MTRIIVISIAFFLLTTLAQLVFLEYKIADSPTMNLAEGFPSVTLKTEDTSDAALKVVQLKAFVWLEKSALELRYHQAHVSLMSIVWRNYLGFLTGMILALVGAVFILGKLQESVSQLAAKVPTVEVNLKSASPGLVLAGLGVVLMMTTVVTRPKVDTVDSAIYIRDQATPVFHAPGLPPDSENKSPPSKVPPLPSSPE